MTRAADDESERAWDRDLGRVRGRGGRGGAARGGVMQEIKVFFGIRVKVVI